MTTLLTRKSPLLNIPICSLLGTDLTGHISSWPEATTTLVFLTEKALVLPLTAEWLYCGLFGFLDPTVSSSRIQKHRAYKVMPNGVGL